MEKNVSISFEVPESVYGALTAISKAMNINIPTLCTIAIGVGLKSISKKRFKV